MSGAIPAGLALFAWTPQHMSHDLGIALDANARIEHPTIQPYGGEGGMESSTSSEHEENPIPSLIDAVYPSFALLAGMQLDLFTPLRDSPLSTEQVAAAIGVGPAKLKPLLYALVVAGVLQVEGERFGNTDAANRCLVRGSTSCMVDAHELVSDLWYAALKTAESIRTGLPQAKYDYGAMSEDELRHFFRGEHPYALAYGRDLVARYDFSPYRTLLDVGGGSGGLAIAVTESCPHIRATVVDLPGVIPVTRYFIAKAGAVDRVQAEATDVVREPLSGSYDVAVLCALLQVFSPDDARRALKNVGSVVNPDGRVFITGSGIIDSTRTSPPDLVGFNLVFINVYDEGQAYTEQEHQKWLEEASFGDFERLVMPDTRSIITARKIN
jgi:SAM-dependent methyltransferase